MLLIGTYHDAPIFRGPRLTDPEQYRELKAKGVGMILNLERGYWEWFHGRVNEEVMRARFASLTPLHLQLGDLLPPSWNELLTAAGLVRDAVYQGTGVYIHCLHGVDRTGMVSAMVQRQLFGWDKEKCITEMFSLGFHRFPYEALGWVKRLREVL